MARILLADDGIVFDGRSLEAGPLGGVESSVINLVNELAARGHEVEVRNKCPERLDHAGVAWRPIDDGAWPGDVDLYIANRGDKLIERMPEARRTVFWIHNPAGYLMKWRYLSKLWRAKPPIVFIGTVHATTYPGWAPGGPRVVIPYGISEDFFDAEPRAEAPPPHAVFTSNPLRSLDWLLRLWDERIRPAVPGAELHLYTGATTYGAVGRDKEGEMDAVIRQARALAGAGVRIMGPKPKAGLIEAFREARCMLYRGDVNETFCLAVGEAQAMGLPAVVQNRGSVIERVVDGETGFVTKDRIQFADAAVRLLSDDGLWRRHHESAIQRQRSWRWADAAAAFESLIE
ncbi:MAG: glycosyltransferase family 4 protein [Magnetovibrio sp.]|nr:glycosyltransferase family 4 protein [Magnetovibrio sp.]